MKFKFLMLLISLLPTHNAYASDNVIILNKDNTIVLNDEVNSETVSRVMNGAKELDSHLFGSNKPIYLILDTPGGSIEDGLRLIDFLNGLHRPVNTITIFAASMGFQIAQQLKDRLIMPHGKLMSHRAKGQISGEFGGVSPNQLESRLGLWNEIIKEMDEATVKRTNGKHTLESYERLYVPELWLTATKSVSEGFADKIVYARCDKSLSGRVEHKQEFLGLEFKYYTDKCPLNTGISGASASIRTTHGVMDVDQFIQSGGSFGADCLVLVAAMPTRLCSLDTSITPQTVRQVKQLFIDTYTTPSKTDKGYIYN